MGHRATIADVARAAGVSQQTVSRALNNKGEISPETRARILEIIEQLGYRPSTIARSLVTQRTMILGLVVPDIANPFFSEVVRGAEDAAQDAGYSLLLGNTIEDPGREESVLHTLEAQRVDGIILCSSRLPDDKLVALAARQPAVVLVNRRLSDHLLRSVSVDDEAGAQTAVRHLLAAGRRTIACLAGPASSHSGRDREAGYRRSLVEAGMFVDPALVLNCAPFRDGGRAAAEVLLSRCPTLDAILCYNDLVAVGALQACADLGRHVPRDVAVVGCDDIMLAALVNPSLTTLRSEKRKLGATAVHLLLEQLNNCPGDCTDVLLQPELIVRASAPSGQTVPAGAGITGRDD